jgi:hypothetical protein
MQLQEEREVQSVERAHLMHVNEDLQAQLSSMTAERATFATTIAAIT